MQPDLDQPLTQEAFGALVGVSQPAVSVLVRDGVLAPGASGHAWLLAYCARIREQAAGRFSAGELDLAQERAALARSQRVAVDLKNAIARGEYARVELLTDVLASASSSVASRLDGIDGLLRKIAPALDENTRTAVLSAIAAARNELVRATAKLVDTRLEELAADELEDEQA